MSTLNVQVIEDEAPQGSELKRVRIQYPSPVGIFDDDPEGQAQPTTPPVIVPQQSNASATATSSSQAMAIDVPQTPDVLPGQPTTPRGSPVTRQHEVEGDDHESKRARVESQKKQRLERISAE